MFHVFPAGSMVTPAALQVNLPFQCAVGPSGRTRVDVKLVLILKSLKLVCVSRDEDIHVQLPLEKRQAGHVAPGDDLVPVDETNLELAHGDHLLLGVVQVLRGKDDSNDNSSLACMYMMISKRSLNNSIVVAKKGVQTSSKSPRTMWTSPASVFR